MSSATRRISAKGLALNRFSRASAVDPGPPRSCTATWDPPSVPAGRVPALWLLAARGARVVLAARNETDLRRAVEGIRRNGGRAIFVAADVALPEEADRIAGEAIREYGRIDTWVNNAAVAEYGRLMDLPIPDMRRQFDVNYWGQVYGSRAAVPHLRREGVALINVASALADRAIPLQGNYSAAKHALKAFTDSLRMELEEAGAPISVTLIKPGRCCRGRWADRGGDLGSVAPVTECASLGASLTQASSLESLAGQCDCHPERSEGGHARASAPSLRSG